MLFLSVCFCFIQFHKVFIHIVRDQLLTLYQVFLTTHYITSLFLNFYPNIYIEIVSITYRITRNPLKPFEQNLQILISFQEGKHDSQFHNGCNAFFVNFNQMKLEPHLHYTELKSRIKFHSTTFVIGSFSVNHNHIVKCTLRTNVGRDQKRAT